jgi:hypothetical protein
MEMLIFLFSKTNKKIIKKNTYKKKNEKKLKSQKSCVDQRGMVSEYIFGVLQIVFQNKLS